jgi:subtilisin-like proprotein convertase family protein
MTLESLEVRSLMAVLPAALTAAPVDVSRGSANDNSDESTPSIVVDPTNPNHLVSTWTRYDSDANSIDGSFNYGIGAAVSNDGGATWTTLNTPGRRGDPTRTTAPFGYTYITDSSVAFARDGSFYLLEIQHNNSNAGEVVLARYSSAGALSSQTTVYSWNRAVTGQDRQRLISQAVLAVDNTAPTFTDPTTGATVTNPGAGNVYIAWVADTPPPTNPPPWNRTAIEMVTSTDGGATFGAEQVLSAGGNGLGNAYRNMLPRIAVSQGGTGGAAPGQVTVVWEQAGTTATRNGAALSDILSRRLTPTGGTMTLGVQSRVSDSIVLSTITGLGSTAGVGAAPVIASDNTLGSFSANQGRLYVVFTDRDNRDSQNPATNTDIYLAYSDNGGVSWQRRGATVNQDWSQTDGYSERAQNGQGWEIAGRAQSMPQVAVDPWTGTLVVSWYDARHDAAQARLSNYVTTSIDGGGTFGGETFVNAKQTVTDLSTGTATVIGPVPDNQSAGNPLADATFTYGWRQGLAVLGGHVYAAWSSNENAGARGDSFLDIRVSQATIAAGPRVVSGTSGVVGRTGDTLNPLPADGTGPSLSNIRVVFDRAVDASTFTGSDVTIVQRDVAGNVVATITGGAITVTPATGMATTFTLSFAAQKTPGTYAYTVGPNVSDRIRRADLTGSVVATGNLIDQDGNAVTGNSNLDVFEAPKRLNPATQPLRTAPFTGDTLPLIIPGPSVVSTSLPGYAATADNLALNGTVSTMRVTFDRLMDVSSFTLADVLRIMGPAGEVASWSSVLGAHVGAAQWFGGTGTGFATVSGQVATSSIIINHLQPFTIDDLNLRLDVTHGDLSKLAFSLVFMPSGATAAQAITVPLIAAGDLSGANMVGTTLSDDDDASRTILQGSAPYTGIFKPVRGALSAFDGKDLEGVWTLQVTDTGSGIGGQVEKWSLEATPKVTVTVTPVNPSNGAARAFDVSFPTQELSGTYTMEFGPDILSAASLLPIGGILVDSNQNAGLDSLRGTGAETTTTVTVPSVNIPVTLYQTVYSVTTATTITPGATTEVPVSLGNQPGSATVSVVLPTINLTSPRLSDLTGYLVAPNGTAVRLFSGLSGTALSGTTFDDSASTPIGSGTGTYSGSFRPEQPLSALAGLSQRGTWILRIVDAGSGSTGSVTGWTLTLPPSRSTITVSQAFSLQDLNLILSITHPNVPDLDAYLVAPDGRRIKLFAGVGNTGTRANFDGTIFDDGTGVNHVGPDGVTPITPIGNGGPPFRGRFRPQEALNALVGSTSAGTYTLEVINRGTQAGTLTSWSLELAKAVTGTGLGEAVADRFSTSFRIFTTDSTNSLSSSTWTAVGPASSTGSGFGNTTRNNTGRMSAIAVDPSDASGNTVFAAAASGGVWKTTNFLTTSSNGPTWIPLTDFGPTSGLNIGAITVFPVNGDPAQSIIFAVTGEANAASLNQAVSNTSRGVGILRSTDGGATWTLLNSTDNTLAFAARDKALVGSSGYAITVDPKAGPAGVIVYAALGGTNGGLWRSLDTGEHWERVRAGTATDVVLDPVSGTFDAISNPRGNLQIVYAAFAGQGVFRNVNQGKAGSWVLMAGGEDRPLVRDADTGTAFSVANDVSPNVATSNRVVLAKPALVLDSEANATRKNLFYQNWLYAAVSDGSTVTLYMTKDAGRNWTRVQLPAVTRNDQQTISSNGGSGSAGAVTLTSQGGYTLTLEVDPTNPNVVYLGGDINPTLIRVDVTDLIDAHSYYISMSSPDGGTRTRYAATGVTVKAGTAYDDPTQVYDPRTSATLNLSRNPNDPLGETSTITVSGADQAAGFSNTGYGATWKTFGQDQISGPDERLLLGIGQSQQEMVVIRDPLTGKARLIVGYDNGLATMVDDGNGELLRNVGANTLVTGVRNGNLQTAQFYYGGVQPSSVDLTSAVYSTMFLGGTQDIGMTRSSGTVFDTGAIGSGTSITLSNPFDPSRDAIAGDAGAVWTDQQGSGTVFQYVWASAPISGQSDFFQVNGIGRTNGLINPNDSQNSWIGSGNNFLVNPLNNRQLIISSMSGRLYRTQDQGQNWYDIGPIPTDGTAPGSFDGSLLRGLAYGAPDPAITGNATDDFIYVGSANGRIWVTTNGGGTWRELSGGLSGGAVRAIITNPTRGSHEAYAVTSRGVFHIADSLATGATWQNVSGNLFDLTHDIFGNPDQNELILSSTSTLKSLAVDWRYVIPDSFNPDEATTDHSTSHPILYVAGEGGVFRSIDDGVTWSEFPSAEKNSVSTTPTPPGSGGGLPNADVTDLDMSLGKIDPTTGRAVADDGDLNVLVASTYGRGQYAIRLAPQVFADTLRMVKAVPDKVTPTQTLVRDSTPTVRGISQQTAFGSTVYVTLYDMTDPTTPVYVGGYDPSLGDDPDTNPTMIVANQTDTRGLFSVMVTQALADGVHVLGVQATDQAGLVGNIALLDEITVETLDLQSTSDTGFYNDDNITRFNNSGPIDPLDSRTDSPVFDVTAVGSSVTVRLYRSGVLVNTLTNVTPVNYTVAIADINGGGGAIPDGTYVYTAVVTAGATTQPTRGPLTVTIETTPPDPAPGQIALAPESDTGTVGDNVTADTAPYFTVPVAGAESNVWLRLYRRYVDPIDGHLGSQRLVTTLTTEQLAAATIGGVARIRDTGPVYKGIFQYEARYVDIAGNEAASPSVIVTFTTTTLAAPDLVDASDTGDSPTDNITNDTSPDFQVVGSLDGVLVQLLRKPLGAADTAYVVVGTRLGSGVATDGTTPADGMYEYAYRQLDPEGANWPGGSLDPLHADFFSISPSLTVEIDTTVATPPAADLQADSDSGWENDDNYTSIAITGPRVFDVVLGTGVTETHPEALRLRLLRRPASGAVFTEVGTRTGAGTIADAEVLADGEYVYVVEQLDIAGNVSARSAELLVTYDSTAPSTPTGPTLHPDDDSGAKGDNITNVTRPRLVGTGEGSSLIDILNAAGSAVGSSLASAGGSYTVTPQSSLPEGLNPLRARSTDRAGNQSALGTTLNLRIQTVSPAAPTLILDPTYDTGVVGDNITSVVRPWLAGVAVPNSRIVMVRLRNASNPGQGWIELGETVSRADGVYRFQTPSDLVGNPPTSYVFYAVVFDVANNATWSAPLTVTIDTTTPGAGPTLALFAGNSTDPGDDTGIVGDNTTIRRRPRFVGHTIANATVEVLRVDLPTPQVVGTAIADVAGNFVLTLAQDLVNGSITLQARVRNAAGTVGPLGPSLRVKITSADFDFDNDGKADPATYRASTGLWSILNSSNGTVQTRTLGGVAGYVPLAGDFNGDGRSDSAIFQPGTFLSTWLLQTSTSQTPQSVQWGLVGDVPLTGDFDGDGLTDLAVWRANAYPGYSAAWYVLPRSGPTTIYGTTWGLPGDIPVAADFDGDGKADLAVFRQTTSPNKGVWYVKYSSGGMLHDDGPFAGWFGLAGDIPTAGDFLKADPLNPAAWTETADGKADFAVYRPSNQTWYVRPVSINGSTPVLTVRIPGSQPGDLPAQADYDGDGKTDFALYRPSTGQYLIRRNDGTVLTVQPGVGGDLAVLGPLSHRMNTGGGTMARTSSASSGTVALSASIPIAPGASSGGDTATTPLASATTSAPTSSSSSTAAPTTPAAGLNFGKTASRLAAARQKAAAQKAAAQEAAAARLAAVRARQQQAALGGAQGQTATAASRTIQVLRRFGALKG